MGTDIHMRAEFRRGPDRPWEAVGAIFPYRYYDPITDTDPERSYPAKPMTAEPYGDRNYVTFAVLADVRNGYGFAGVKTHEPLRPISEPKGLPADIAFHASDDRYGDEDEPRNTREGYDTAADKVEYMQESWIFGDHSFTHLTLRELLAYDWDQTLADTGAVTAAEYNRCKAENDTPSSWCGSVGGGGIETITVDEAERRIAAGTFPSEVGEKGSLGFSSKVYVQYEWTEPLRDRVGDNFLTLLKQMSGWGRFDRDNQYEVNGQRCTSDPDNIRLVFGFDS